MRESNNKTQKQFCAMYTVYIIHKNYKNIGDDYKW